jgi:hypothetical protein
MFEQVPDASGFECELAYEPELEVELDLYYAYDPDLEVELELVPEPPVPSHGPRAITPEDVARAAIHARRAAATISVAPAALDDDWFGSFDETKPVEGVYDFDDGPTSPWRRLSDWLLRRAA